MLNIHKIILIKMGLSSWYNIENYRLEWKEYSSICYL